MRVKCGFSESEEDLTKAVEDTLMEASHEAGQLEVLSCRVGNLVTTLSSLISLLVDKGVMTLDDVNATVGPLYPFKEIA